jgi:hypothetical protein
VKFSVHLNERNWLRVFQVLCVIGLAVIPLFVSSDHLSSWGWKSLIVFIAAVAIAVAIRQAHVQSKEDAQREERERENRTSGKAR